MLSQTYEGQSLWHFQLVQFKTFDQSLGYEKFSVLGWSDGSRSALILTSLYPNNVESLILFGIIEKDFEKTNIKAFNITNDVNKWHKNIVNNYLRSYKDQDQIQQLWTELMTFVLKMHEYFPNGVLQDFDSIKCPVLIIQGDCVCDDDRVISNQFNLNFLLLIGSFGRFGTCFVCEIKIEASSNHKVLRY